MNRCQTKALREGCHERKKARVGVSSREKMNTNMNLVRVTTKSKSETQTVVKNGFSNLTKVQKGRDRQRKDVEGDHQGKALKEGCRERRWARMGVSSREEINT